MKINCVPVIYYLQDTAVIIPRVSTNLPLLLSPPEDIIFAQKRGFPGPCSVPEPVCADIVSLRFENLDIEPVAVGECTDNP